VARTDKLFGTLQIPSYAGVFHSNQYTHVLDDFLPADFPLYHGNYKEDGYVESNTVMFGHERFFKVIDGTVHDGKYCMILGEHDNNSQRFETLKDREEYLKKFVSDKNALLIIKCNTEPFEREFLQDLNYIYQSSKDPNIIANRVVIIVNDQFTRRTFESLLSELGTMATFYTMTLNSYLRPEIEFNDTDTYPSRISLYTRAFKSNRAFLYLKMIERDVLDKIWYTFWPYTGYNPPETVSSEFILEELNRGNGSRNYLSDRPELKQKFLEWLADAPHTISKFDNYITPIPTKNFQPPIHIVVETIQHCLSQKPTWVENQDGYNHHINEFTRTFITEKTLRLMLKKKAFIIYGPPRATEKIRAMGFKTFSKWWDEDSLSCQNVSERIDAICDITEYITSMSDQDFRNMIADMSEVLEHNYNLALLYAKQDLADAVALKNHIKGWCNE